MTTRNYQELPTPEGDGAIGNLYVRGDIEMEGDLVTPGQPPPESGVAVGGSVVFDGSAVPAGTSRSGSVYTVLGEDKHYENCTVNAGITVQMNGYRMHVRGVLTNNGVIANDGTDAAANLGGAGAAAGSISGGTAGGNGSAAGAGAAGTAVSGVLPINTASSTALGGAVATPGSPGNVISRGGGGGGAASGNAGGSGGNITTVANSTSGGPAWPSLMAARPFGSTTAWQVGSGGGGGGGNGTGVGGGGGGAGGWLVVAANRVEGNGVIRANGGRGGDASGQGGGGGGGGGGVVVFAYRSGAVGQVVQANGGSGGLGAGGGGGGGLGASGWVFRVSI